jgi:5-methyltetrahydrofolate--homocysteine methyltransferase
MGFRDEPILIFDGSCGASLEAMDLPAEAWGGVPGCNEQLNLSAPEAVIALHRGFLDAGAMVLETNTFGGTRLVLDEFGLGARVEEINRAAVDHARAAIAGAPGRYVAGSVGSGTRLPSLGHIAPAALGAAYEEQLDALVAAGVDALIIETCQDPLQAKCAVIAAFAVLERRGADVPVLLSLTVEPGGTMLLGTAVAAAAATFQPFPLFSLGLNCATGPEPMAPHLGWLARRFPGRISVMPNAGMPEVVGGATRYPLGPEEFARQLRRFVADFGVSVVGGCCGTTPAHIRRLVEVLDGVSPAGREPEARPALSSLFDAVDLDQDPKPLIIGERMNASGSRRFRKLLLAGDFEGCAGVGAEQERAGAHALDVCAATAGRDEAADLARLVESLRGAVRSPLAIDTTNPEALAAALERAPGRCLINSINLEDGGASARKVLALARRHGAAVIALTIGPGGMAMTAADKLSAAERIHALAVGEMGLGEADLFFDALTFTLGSGDPAFDGSAAETLEGIRRIKARFPECRTSLGVSNVSYGLPPEARKVLNSVFLHEAIRAGLDAAIVDAGAVVPVAGIPAADRAACLDLIRGHGRGPAATPLETFLARFADRPGPAGPAVEVPAARLVAEREVERKILAGDRDGLGDLLAILLEQRRPLAVVSEVLVPAMRRVGALFGRGELLLPFVLRSAEAMKAAVTLLEPAMEQAEREAGTRVLLATVQGDIHDIGKNLVGIILANNGYRVIDLGTNVPVERVIEEARSRRADVIGLSGLLVRSALAMRDCLPRLREAGIEAPVLLGGAALTPGFVAESCAPAHHAPVVYCADAFDGLEAVRRHEAGALVSTVAPAAGNDAPRPAAGSPVTREGKAPAPPFLGVRHEADVDRAAVLARISRQALVRGRWGLRRGERTEAEYRALLDAEAEPALAALSARFLSGELGEPKVARGWFRCRSEGDRLVIGHDGREHALAFPRQGFPPHRCIADFFRTADEGGDAVGLFVATLGEAVMERIRRLHAEDRYRDWLMLHGFAAELTDALAGHVHAVMRAELGIEGGQRYGLGYPACPDLDGHLVLFELLGPAAIGVSLTEGMELVPSVSTSAIVAHHPRARYFAV